MYLLKFSLKRWRSAHQRREKMEKLLDGAGKGWETWVLHEVRDRHIYKKKDKLFVFKKRNIGQTCYNIEMII